MTIHETPRINILGSPVLRITKEAFLGELGVAVRSRMPGQQVVTLNVDMVVQTLDDKTLAAAVKEATFVVADGVPLIWYSRCVRAEIPERINGTDLVDDIARLSAIYGWRLFFLGSTAAACLGTIERLAARHPGVVVAGSYQPPFGEWDAEEEEVMAARVRSAQADVAFVGLGTPRQECWIHRYGVASGASLLIGIGGSFDILSGRLRRAPVWLQRNGLEWAWRLMLEPRRLAHRYLVRDVRFVLEVFRYHVTRTGKYG